jgi:hypothetical protein
MLLMEECKHFPLKALPVEVYGVTFDKHNTRGKNFGDVEVVRSNFPLIKRSWIGTFVRLLCHKKIRLMWLQGKLRVLIFTRADHSDRAV